MVENINSAEGWSAVAFALFWKALVTAAVIIIVATIAERAGPVLAAILMGLPMSIGPTLALLTITHGEAFVVESTRHALASVFGVMAFLVGYVRTARRTGLWGSLAAGFAAWLTAALIIGQFPLTIWAALAIALSGFALTHLTLPRHPPPTPRYKRHPWRYLLARRNFAGLVVAIVVTAGRLLGPALAGFFASLPVIFGSAAWMLATLGNNNLAAATLSHADRGMWSFVAFCFVVATLASYVSIWLALTGGVLVSILVSVILVSRVRRAP